MLSEHVLYLKPLRYCLEHFIEAMQTCCFLIGRTGALASDGVSVTGCAMGLTDATC